jgi:hypothetical protein
MSLNSKRDNFELSDFQALARRFNIPGSRAKNMIKEVSEAVGLWSSYAREAGIAESRIENRAKLHRLFT